jgi:subtilisin family serine protease
MLLGVVAVLVVSGVALSTFAASAGPASPTADGGSGLTPTQVKTSHRVIVELQSPPLAIHYKTMISAQAANGRLDVQSAAAQQYVAQLKAEQAAFVSTLQATIPGASVSTYINENGAAVTEAYQVVMNAVVVDPGQMSTSEAMRQLAKLPGVKAVYPDYAYSTDLYTSTSLINAPAIWNSVGGRANGGAGVKIASMDGGIHKDAPMFNGAGFSYPSGWPPNGLGLTANNNGKIIASRAYFRSWDPPAPGDENPWPGENGTPHGVHTAGIAGGNTVTATFAGFTVGQISGVAPGAWLMSYRVFYNSVSGDGSFYLAEGIAALEDIVNDGADVVNNSWGGGPGSAGGQFDPLDQALINAANAGVFVSMSAGNAGPGKGTTDHPSDEYIIVAATSTSGTLAAGKLSVSAPQPVSNTLKNISFASATFGQPIPIGTVLNYPYVAAANVDPANFEGCNPWPAGTFTGKAAVISRGSCQFGTKVLNAENAGAQFVIIYNHVSGGDTLVSMAPGDDGGKVTISSVFIGHTDGVGMVDWQTAHPTDAEFELNTIAFQSGNTADVVASFSSRGPGVGNVLKPDIAAPGVNILSQGYTPGASGEARHMGFGQASGTSMSSPHVAGAAALLRQVHPTWSNAYIKSALMSTAKYMGIYNGDGSPAQPLDIGAGRLDLTNAADPGVILSPPSASFGQVPTGTVKSVVITVTNITTATEMYTLTTLYTGKSFTMTTPLAGFSVSPSSINLAPGASAAVTVEFDSAAGMGMGDNQGYVVLDGDVHEAHFPVWARVIPAQKAADVLLIDNDFSGLLPGFPDYTGYYTRALEALGKSYEVWDTAAACCGSQNIPDAAQLSAYPVVIYFTGDNFYPDGTFTVPTPLTEQDMDILTEYANSGGVVFAMGQDLASVLNSTSEATASFFYNYVLGGSWLQDSISGGKSPSLPVVPLSDGPAAFSGVSLNLAAPDTYLGSVPLSAGEVVVLKYYLPVMMNSQSSTVRTRPSVFGSGAASLSGSANFGFDVGARRLDYSVEISVTTPMTVSSVYIGRGAAGTNGTELSQLLAAPVQVTNTLKLNGAMLLSSADANLLLSDNLYLAVKTSDNPFDALRGQIHVLPVGEGAYNQWYVDEIESKPIKSPNNPEEELPFMPLFKYPGSNNMESGIVAMSHRDQPTLERPGIAYFGRSIYTTFGLEGVNNGVGATDREDLLDLMFKWSMDEPTVTISDTTIVTNSSQLVTFEANVSSPVTDTVGSLFRWDFGDGSPVAGPYTAKVAGHNYSSCGTYTVQVEVTDSYGNKAIGSKQITVSPPLCTPSR